MKRLFFIAVFLLKLSSCQSQNSITGYWYSNDGSRTIKIFEKGNYYEAILLSSERESDTAGLVILFNLTYKYRRKIYQGFIRAADDGMTVQVKIKIEDNGKALKLKLRRMFIFPVYLRWIKAEK
jgi:uncharacterized protein (DUF2147 family)